MRVVGIKSYIDSTCVLILVQDFVPGLAAVNGAENSTLGVRPERMAQRCDINNVRILWIDNHFADRSRVVQAYVFPGLPAVDCFINSVPVRDIATNTRFASANVNDVWIGGRNRQASDRADSLLVENRRPRHRAVGRFPHSAAGRAKIISCGITGYAGSG